MRTYEIYEQILKAKGLKTTDVVNATGLKHANISGWKQGKWELKHDKIEKIAEFLDVPISIFYPEHQDLGLDKDETYIISTFRELNKEGKEMILKYLQFITMDQSYSKKSLGYTDEAI